jgi:hypothetical protein
MVRWHWLHAASAAPFTRDSHRKGDTMWQRGDRVALVYTSDEHTKLQPGDLGTVTVVDDLGTVGVRWDNGSRLGIAEDLGDVIRLA